jgi:Concanavalin A-like lectin/glucanases superfamily
MPYWGGGGYLPIVAYVGPGDIVSGALGWWGLRAYKNSLIGTKAIRLRRNGDNAESDFNTVAGGGLDLAGIATFIAGGGSNAQFVSRLYDQSGNGNDMTQSTAANQPNFGLNIIGSLPGVFYTFSAATILNSTLAIGNSLPLSWFAVSNPSNFGVNGTRGGPLFGYSSNTGGYELRWYVGTTPANALDFLQQSVADLGNSATTRTASTWYTTDVTYDGTTANFYVNGASDGTVTITNSASSAPVSIGGANATAEGLDGYLNESGIWGSVINSANNTALGLNARNYWGF